MQIRCEVSLGELVDKLSILKIKQQKISDKTKLTHVNHEAEVLSYTLNGLGIHGIDLYLNKLIEINTKLWIIEDEIRDKERSKTFDEKFIALARSVYITNDQRFECKNEINQKYSSGLVEVKSYQKY